MVDFANSNIDEKDKRELSWAVVQGIQAILDVLNSYVQDAANIDAKTKKQTVKKVGE